ncbi:hypothetical protein OM416_20580 [Paenibacillus sp. LS1]|uniref:hypothetical protein n=1 Tax=Paenibacillus sp. LS1 TaxID=2992120 RepID=UPI00222FD7A6|nr:hypothetical protein [Paenibacillus sp. LS1]MCW3793995.1 hypothetical protein [Paenibacillus sp. LS1]
MQDYSIDLASERISHPKTKEYFREVMSSYAIGNYRSAVASLYTIVISDLVFKLKDQVERENDQGAAQILREVDAEKNKNPEKFSSKWESDLVDKVFKETKLLEMGDKAAIDHLKIQRNLSSHPNILDTEENTLFTPSKEDVRAHIRSMLEGVLTKSSVHTARLVDNIIEIRMPELYARADEDTEYDNMFIHRYLKDLNDKAIESLFKKLWKYTFKLEDDLCNKNRVVNARTLHLITNLYPEIVFRCVSSDQVFYSKVIPNHDQLSKMIDFFIVNPRLFRLLDKDIQKDIEENIKKKQTFYVRSVFLSSSLEQHLINTTEYLQGRTITLICLRAYKKLTDVLKRPQDLVKLIFRYYSQSDTYTEAYSRFSLIKRMVTLESLDEAEYHDLLKVMNTTYQIYKGTNCPDLVLEIQEAAEQKLGKKLDLSSYSNLR